MEGAAPQSFLPKIKNVDQEGDEESALECNGGGSMPLQVKVEIPEPTAGEISPEEKSAGVDELAGDGKVEESLEEVGQPNGCMPDLG